MMIRRTAALLLPLAMLSTAARADDGPLTIEASFRARVEGIDGQFRPATDDTAALLLRAIVRAEYDAGPIRIGGEIQDARVYFERRNSSVSQTEVDAVEPVQAYLVGELARDTDVKIGRFTMDVGSRRLVSRQNFRNSTNAFTGAKFDWHPRKGDGLTLFWTLPQSRLPDDRAAILDNEFKFDRERSALQFFGGDATRTLAGGIGVEAYVYRLAERDGANFLTRNRHLWTAGGRVNRAPKKGTTDFEIEAAYQGGRVRATTAAADRTDLEVGAWFVHANVGHSFAVAWSPRVVVAYDYASGDGSGRGYGRFDTLFGARASEFGPTSFYGAVSRANLSSPEVRVEVKPDQRWDGYLAVRPLWLANARDSFASTGVRDATGGSGRYAGTQVDGRARYWLKPDVLRLGAGAAWLAKGRFLTDAPNAPSTGDTHFGYVEATYSF